MGKMNKVFVLFLAVLFFATPLFAEELTEEVIVSEEDAEFEEELDEGVLTGKVASLNSDSGLICVKTDDGLEKEFLVVDEETILWEGIEDIELGSINKGNEVEVGYYTDEDGKLVASWVDVFIEDEDMSMEEPEEDSEMSDSAEE